MSFVRFEVFAALTMKNGVCLVVTPCGSCKNRRFGGTYRLHYQGDRNRRARNKISSNQQPKHAAKKYYYCSGIHGDIECSCIPISMSLQPSIKSGFVFGLRRFLEEPCPSICTVQAANCWLLGNRSYAFTLNRRRFLFINKATWTGPEGNLILRRVTKLRRTQAPDSHPTLLPCQRSSVQESLLLLVGYLNVCRKL
jgi:hypothetical protein